MDIYSLSAVECFPSIYPRFPAHCHCSNQILLFFLLFMREQRLPKSMIELCRVCFYGQSNILCHYWRLALD
ncbi:hypothetical protein BJX61DRAFT_498107 [Aspergillus egyptiacus]|nr:hypothetical protein BJX61DRAFT_498107 [Aspergillus egyptiacus]